MYAKLQLLHELLRKRYFNNATNVNKSYSIKYAAIM